MSKCEVCGNAMSSREVDVNNEVEMDTLRNHGWLIEDGRYVCPICKFKRKHIAKNRTQFQKNLRTLRRIKGLTIEQVAESIGEGFGKYQYTEMTSSDERGNLSDSQIEKLAELYGCTVDHLLNGKPEVRFKGDGEKHG